MIVHRSRPLVRGLPFFLLGIANGFGAVVPAKILYSIFLVLFIIFIIYSFLVFHSKGWLSYEFRWFTGFVIFSLLFLCGQLLGELSDERQSIYHFTRQNKVILVVAINEPFVRKGKSLRARVDVIALKNQNTWKPASGKFLMYLPASTAVAPNVGDRLLLNEYPVALQPVINPGQFDFKSWLERKQIYASLFIKDGSWYPLPEYKKWSFNQFVHRCRNRLMELFQAAGLQGNELGVVAALVLGSDDEVDAELMQAFSASGTLHVLSVSGMHVALVYSLIAAVLGYLFRKEKFRWIKLSLILSALWAYAILTGFSPAVQRAAAMLSLIIVGKTVARSTDTWNLLAGSLFILIALQPNLLFECGFQLSYAAVAGIVGFYPWLYQRLDPPGRVGDLIWKSVCVALSAQLFTFPFGLFYFHQFPNYFLPANLLIIPISTVVMFGGIALLLLSPFNLLFELVAAPVQWITVTLTRTVFLFDQLPNAQTTGIWISGFQCLLLMLCVVMATIFLTHRNSFYLMLTFFLLVAFLFSQIVKYYVQSNQIYLIRWQLSGKNNASSLVYGFRSVTWRGEQWSDRSQSVVENGLDALHVARNHRITVNEKEWIVPHSVHFPVIKIDSNIILPDTIIKLSKAPGHELLRQ
ncbi:MAG: hypothetical protein RIQ47_1481 [Bacteroidota bacterium]